MPKIIKDNIEYSGSVDYATGRVTIADYIAAAYITGSGNYIGFSIPIKNKATSVTPISIDSLGVWKYNGRISPDPGIDINGSTVDSISNDFIQISLKFTNTQTANVLTTIRITNFVLDFT